MAHFQVGERRAGVLRMCCGGLPRTRPARGRAASTGLRQGPVLLIAPQPFFRISGTPLSVLHACRALTGMGLQVRLLTLPLGADLEMPGLSYHRVARIPFVKEVPIGLSFAKCLYNIVMVATLIGLLLRQRFAVVHAIEEAALYAVPIARGFGIPAIADLDSDLCQQLREGPRWGRWLARPADLLRRHAIRMSACIVTVAPSLSRLAAEISPQTPLFELKDAPLEQAMVAPDPAAVAQLRREFNLNTDAVIIYTGNFDRRQGVEMLVEAMPAVLARVPEAMLLLAGGTAAEVEAIRGLARRLGVASSVQVIGQRPIEQMPALMALGSVLVSPRREPLVTPWKIYTYMAARRPIVATDLPTHTDVLDSSSAILTPPTAAGLAQGILQALENRDLAEEIAGKARRDVERDHSFERFCQQLGEVYALARAGGHLSGSVRADSRKRRASSTGRQVGS